MTLTIKANSFTTIPLEIAVVSVVSTPVVGFESTQETILITLNVTLNNVAYSTPVSIFVTISGAAFTYSGQIQTTPGAGTLHEATLIVNKIKEDSIETESGFVSNGNLLSGKIYNTGVDRFFDVSVDYIGTEDSNTSLVGATAEHNDFAQNSTVIKAIASIEAT